MERGYIGIGSNIDPEQNILAGLERLRRVVRVTGLSPLYHTEPVGPPGQPSFINGVCEIETELEPLALKLSVLRPIEAALGRERGPDPYAPRPLDLDLLLLGDRVVNTPELTLPDPDIHQRPYLLAGLSALNAASFSSDAVESGGGLDSSQIHIHKSLTDSARGLLGLSF